MRVLIDTTFALRAPRSGTAVYLERLCHELEASAGVEVVAVANRRRRSPAGGGVGSVRNLGEDVLWTAVELPRLARRARVDVIHHPLPALAPRSPVPQAVTVMDLAFERLPACFDRRFRLYAHNVHRLAARRAQAVVCISHTTAADVQELWRVPRERLVVAPLGPGQVTVGRRPAAGEQGSYFLYVGDAEPRKNLGVLLEGYRRYRQRSPQPVDLVLAGAAGRAAGVAGRPGIRALDLPSAERLVAAYADALALVHPSRYEGFGLTPLEAMALGTPVLAARAPGVSEVCGDAVLYADPQDADAFAEGLARLVADRELRERLAERGRARAREFSWPQCARFHARAYALACSGA